VRTPWTFHLHPDAWALAFVLIGAWWVAVRRERARTLMPAVTPRQTGCWILGVAILWIGADWPMHDVAERSLYSVHMLQHLLFTLAAAPLLLLGTPAWMARKILRPAWLLRAVRFGSRPLIALVLFNGLLVFTHWPLIVEQAVGHEAIHFGLHTLLVGSALLMWMPVASPLLEIPRLSFPGQMIYLFLQSLVPTVPASFLTFGQRPLYHVYEPFLRPWNISALADQRTAGLIMKILGGLILWAVITVIWFRWYSVEHNEGVDVTAHRDVDRDLNRTRLGAR
jgi:putative membrane protein